MAAFLIGYARLFLLWSAGLLFYLERITCDIRGNQRCWELKNEQGRQLHFSDRIQTEKLLNYDKRSVSW